ncbi:hypothetical protein PR202_gb27704 [Eleusine coracana subsp. coracana]|uniref:Uncharacterized protein n=1 Tax=Eleusine coracana subsp. coracana TaxID=191504 RepID=A0AAV5FUV7_ELECO|nr:hypothetical protein PR202_gb27704 [Eleusine coracana subsp. coracana]
MRSLAAWHFELSEERDGCVARVAEIDGGGGAASRRKQGGLWGGVFAKCPLLWIATISRTPVRILSSAPPLAAGRCPPCRNREGPPYTSLNHQELAEFPAPLSHLPPSEALSRATRAHSGIWHGGILLSLRRVACECRGAPLVAPCPGLWTLDVRALELVLADSSVGHISPQPLHVAAVSSIPWPIPPPL